jgi:ABC-type glycerol-3-phosphate transport system permease component
LETITWQWPANYENPIKIRTWIPLDLSGPSSALSNPRDVRLTVRLQRSSTIHAWIEKLAMNYRQVLDYIPFMRYLRISLFVAIANIVLTLIFSPLIAYAFARLKWPGREFCFILMLGTMMIPPQVLMIPHFLIWKSIGAYNTLTPLWVGSIFGNAFFIFLLRQFMRGIPPDLEEAALIDGCGFIRIYWHVILPLIKPALAAITIFTFLASWNDFMGPLIYVADQRLYPLAFGLFAFAVQVNNSPTIVMAASLLMTLPIVIIFLGAQKHFVEGLTLTGMKG